MDLQEKDWCRWECGDIQGQTSGKGYSQHEGIDYQDTFSSVAMLKHIHTLLAVAAYFDYEIWQMDVKIAFLNRYLEEDIYME